jgi:hypothetical protein
VKTRATTQGVIVQQDGLDKSRSVEKFAFFNEDGSPYTPGGGSPSAGVNFNGVWRWHTDPDYIPERWGEAGSSEGVSPTSASNLRLHNNSRDGFDFQNVMLALKVGAQVYAQQADDATTRALFEVTAPPTSEGNYVDIPVSVLTSIGSDVDMEDVVFLFPLSTG